MAKVIKTSKKGLTNYKKRLTDYKLSVVLLTQPLFWCLVNYASVLSYLGFSVWLMCCSRWQMRTSMPNFSWRCSARCWAE